MTDVGADRLATCAEILRGLGYAESAELVLAAVAKYEAVCDRLVNDTAQLRGELGQARDREAALRRGQDLIAGLLEVSKANLHAAETRVTHLEAALAQHRDPLHAPDGATSFQVVNHADHVLLKFQKRVGWCAIPTAGVRQLAQACMDHLAVADRTQN